jgi:hypothetical protein
MSIQITRPSYGQKEIGHIFPGAIPMNEVRVGIYAEYMHDGRSEYIEVSRMHLRTNSWDDCLTDEHVIKYSNEYLAAIPLTEEWLLMMGFIEKHRDELHANFFLRNQFSVHHKLIGDEYLESGFYVGEYVKIEHVHQLQNYYFVMTGKELL